MERTDIYGEHPDITTLAVDGSPVPETPQTPSNQQEPATPFDQLNPTSTPTPPTPPPMQPPQPHHIESWNTTPASFSLQIWRGTTA